MTSVYANKGSLLDICIQDTLSSRAALGLRLHMPSASREQRHLSHKLDIYTLYTQYHFSRTNFRILHTIYACIQDSLLSRAALGLPLDLVYKIPYRRAPRLACRLHVQPLSRARRASKGILHITLGRVHRASKSILHIQNIHSNLNM